MAAWCRSLPRGHTNKILFLWWIQQLSKTAIAFTRGPGLLGSLLVGTSFAKGFALAQNIKMVEVNHLHGHILAHFLKIPNVENKQPAFPFLSLLVSGGHTQIVLVKDFNDMTILGQTIENVQK